MRGNSGRDSHEQSGPHVIRYKSSVNIKYKDGSADTQKLAAHMNIITMCTVKGNMHTVGLAVLKCLVHTWFDLFVSIKTKMSLLVDAVWFCRSLGYL